MCRLVHFLLKVLLVPFDHCNAVRQFTQLAFAIEVVTFILGLGGRDWMQ